jgi:hypothetical protein
MRVMYKKQCTCTSTSTKYSLHSIVEDDVRGCLTSTKYWIPSASWRWCQRLFDFYQILNSFNKLKMMSEVVLLPNTEFLQQVEDDVRGCLTSTDLLQRVEDDVTQCSKQYTPSCQILLALSNTQHLVRYY